MVRLRLFGVRTEISFGFLLVLCVCAVNREKTPLLWALAFMAAHELGHLGALLLCGGRLRRLRLLAGRLVIEQSAPLPQTAQGLVLAAGPGANLALSAGLALTGRTPLAATNLCLALFNLLPAGELDGARLVRLALTGPDGRQKGERLCAAGSFLLSVGQMGCGLALMLGDYRNPTLFLASLWLFVSSVQNMRYTF